MKKTPSAAFAVLALLLAGCASSAPVNVSLPADARLTVAVAEFSQETNSFSPVKTTVRDFEAAIEEGSTLVRIGTALFGARQAAWR